METTAEVQIHSPIEHDVVLALRQAACIKGDILEVEQIAVNQAENEEGKSSVRFVLLEEGKRVNVLLELGSKGSYKIVEIFADSEDDLETEECSCREVIEVVIDDYLSEIKAQQQLGLMPVREQINGEILPGEVSQGIEHMLNHNWRELRAELGVLLESGRLDQSGVSKVETAVKVTLRDSKGEEIVLSVGQDSKA